MARCSQCNAMLVISGVTVGENRYCSAKCAAKSFLPVFWNAFREAEATNPLPFEDSPPIPQKETVSDELVESSSDRQSYQDFMILVLGTSMVFAAIVLIQWVFSYVNYPFFEQTFLFVMPLGAFLCGFGAGAGFWFALLKLDRRPTAITYGLAFCAGVVAFIGIYYLIWLDTKVGGVALKDQLSFLDFLQTWVANQRIRIGRGGAGKPIELGKLGYARFALNWIGFSLGVLSGVSLAGSRSYCARCGRYFRPQFTQTRSFADPVAAGQVLSIVSAALVTGRLQLAVEEHLAQSLPKSAGYLSSILKVERCPGCGCSQAKLIAQIPGDRSPEEIPGFAFQGTSSMPVHDPSHARTELKP